MASNSSIGRQIDVLKLEEALEKCSSLANALKQLTERIPNADMRWLGFAIYQDIMWSTSEERSPLSASLIHKAQHPSDDENWHSWDMIHFTAQVEASLYSLRITLQVLDVVISLCSSLPPQVRDVCQHLSTLPLIADWPTVANMPNLLAAAREADILTTVTDILGIPPIGARVESAETDDLKERKKRKSRNDRSERDSKRPVSINPFAVLRNASQD